MGAVAGAALRAVARPIRGRAVAGAVLRAVARPIRGRRMVPACTWGCESEEEVTTNNSYGAGTHGPARRPVATRHAWCWHATDDAVG